MRVITIDGYPASGKTTIRECLYGDYRVAIPERFYRTVDMNLENEWIDFTDKGQVSHPRLSHFFPLLTYKRISSHDTRFSHYDSVSVEDFFICLYDAIHEAGWDERERVLRVFNRVLRLDFDAYPMFHYFISVPLGTCEQRRPDFDWVERKKNNSEFQRFWEWLEPRFKVKVLDGYRAPKELAIQIAKDIEERRWQI